MEKKFDWGSFLLGILFIIVALFAFQDPVGDLAAIVLIFGCFAILKGIFELFLRNRLKTLTGSKTWMLIIVGIIDILIGVFLLFNLQASILALPYVFAIWFIIDSVFGLFTLDYAREVSNGYYWFTIIVNILGILLGIMLLFNPLSSALTLAFLVGMYFMFFGIMNIVYSFR
ncbi:acid-resistance membrane protein [Enterococcus canis]|uniref:Acid-resistance membrane protein n=1 Tax=Enterococcus canis TaxID=214095 RepID=A0A1L8RIW0_9ENTE|nr:DUF308 domain-containing protein [Enterococcus canis]OJG19673.1 acid-resistance membrane protein [Enterococcus canis]